jgi:hypothetical protein
MPVAADAITPTKITEAPRMDIYTPENPKGVNNYEIFVPIARKQP